MGFTRINTWIGIILMFSIITVTLMIAGNNLQDRADITLSDRSNDYIDNYRGFVSTQKMDLLSGDASEFKADPIITESNDTGQQSGGDVLASQNSISEKISKLFGFFRLIYNMPTFTFSALGIPLDEVSHITNILTFMAFIILTYLLIRAWK